MITILHNASTVVTVDTSGVHKKRASEMRSVTPLQSHSVVIEDAVIKDVVPAQSITNTAGRNIIDISGKTVLPGIVEAHTHTVFAGSRAEEFRMRLAGASYEEIAEAGGGINTTVQAVRNHTAEELAAIAAPRVKRFLQQGVTTLEIKSGYGLDMENELKMLRAAKLLDRRFPVDIKTTFLGAHTFPPEYRDNREGYLKLLIDEMLPAVASEKLADYCDAFCEATAFHPHEVAPVFTAARELGMKLKLHTEQFNSIGGIDLALEQQVGSVEHLEVIDDDGISKLSGTDITAVLLPGVSYFLRYGYAPARKLIDAGCCVAIASDYNPGSSHISNIFFIMNLSALYLGMSVEETITAYTINAAHALGLSESRGSIEPGKLADLAVYDYEDYSPLVYHTAENACSMTLKNGKTVYKRKEVENEDY